MRFNAYHEFMGGPRTAFSSENGPIPFQTPLGAYRGEINARVTRQFARIGAFFANAGYQHAFDQNTYAWTGKLGVRFDW